MDLQQHTSIVDTEGESDGLSEKTSGDDDEHKSSLRYNPEEEYASLPIVTLSSLTETGKEESNIPVLKQRSYTGRQPVIPCALADTPCADLGVEGVLEKLNTILGTSYTLDESVISVLNSYVAQNYDFGTAYAYLRPYWKDIPTMEHKLRANEEEDREIRRKVLVDGRITQRDVAPRRVWDLCANRVVPYWVAGKRPRGISHAWVDKNDRVDVMTPINGYEWPVPMPKDASLDLIRIEMLNLYLKSIRTADWSFHTAYQSFHTGYAWLDVLCLRQEGGRREDLRMEEWKLDVPTIGSVYRQYDSCVVCYFSGLGRPLNYTLDDFESDQCWFRRAWTLQEITEHAIIGGETDNDVMEKDVQKRFDEQLVSLWKVISSGRLLYLVSEMQNRVSTKPLDRVAGLAYLSHTMPIPIYDAQQSEADAWEALLDAMAPSFRAHLLFFYPMPGEGRKCWRPSWQQLMTNKIIVPQRWALPQREPLYISGVFRTEDTDSDWYEGDGIDSADVRGLSEVPAEKKLRRGELAFKDANGAPHTLKIVANHAYPIPDGLYTVIACRDHLNSEPNGWVVGWRRKDGNFEKLSVFLSADDEEVAFAELGLLHRVKTVLS